jgi:hypothetical protein
MEVENNFKSKGLSVMITKQSIHGRLTLQHKQAASFWGEKRNLMQQGKQETCE